MLEGGLAKVLVPDVSHAILTLAYVTSRGENQKVINLSGAHLMSSAIMLVPLLTTTRGDVFLTIPTVVPE